VSSSARKQVAWLKEEPLVIYAGECQRKYRTANALEMVSQFLRDNCTHLGLGSDAHEG